MAKGLIFFVAFPLVLAISAFSQTDDSPRQKKEVAQAEIQKLIADLGHADFRVRDKAMKRLEEIGEPVLETLVEGKKLGDPETSRRVDLILRKIESRSNPATRENGMEFKLIVDKEWIIPNRVGEKKSIDIALQLKNISDQPCVFYPGAIALVLSDAARKEVPRRTMTYHPTLVAFTPPLEKNQVYSVPINAELVHGPERNYLRTTLDFGTFDTLSNLAKGTYEIKVKYRNVRDASWFAQFGLEPEQSVWTGQLETHAQKVLLR